MVTRFYFPGFTGSAPSISPATSPLWTAVSANFNRRKLVTSPTDTAHASIGSTETVAATLQDLVARQQISDPIPYNKTISGKFTCVFCGTENNAAADAILQIIIRVLSGDGTVERGVLYAGQTDTTVVATSGAPNQEYPAGAGSQRTRYLQGISMNPVAAQIGDVLVVEVGARNTNISATAYTTSIYFGDPAASPDYVLNDTQSDLVGRPWLEFDSNIFEGTTGGGPGSIMDRSMSAVTIAGYTNGTVVDREYAYLKAKTAQGVTFADKCIALGRKPYPGFVTYP